MTLPLALRTNASSIASASARSQRRSQPGATSSRARWERRRCHGRRLQNIRATPSGDDEDATTTNDDATPSLDDAATRQAVAAARGAGGGGSRKRKVESTDAISTALTRRFGLGGGLAWLGFLTFGVVGEQIKTRLEKRAEEANTVAADTAELKTTASGLEYKDTKLGGGSYPRPGDLVIMHYRAFAGDVLYEDTHKGKQIAFVFGARPLPPGIAAGFEEAVSTMRAGGVREVTVPPSLGFGDRTVGLEKTKLTGSPFVIPANSTLRYEIELFRVSIAPS